MKLIPQNKNWQIQTLGRRNVDNPMREANAVARASQAWGNMGRDAGNVVSKISMDIYEKSSQAEAQALYVKAMGDLNGLENTLYTNQQLDMNSNEMEGVSYDDSYSQMVDGKQIDGNRGFAPVHAVGAQVWSSRTGYIVDSYSSQASSDKVRGILQSKLQPSITSKNQSVGRHIIELAVADKRASVKLTIEDSRKIGDLPGALAMSEEAYRRGVISQDQANEYDKKSYQENDIRIFRNSIANSDSEVGLAQLSDTIIFSNNNLTPSQKAQISNEALSKARYTRQLRKEELGEWNDDNEVGAIIDYHGGATGVEQLIQERGKYSREGFTRLYSRMTSKHAPSSDRSTLTGFQQRIVDMPFNTTADRALETVQLEIMEDMHEAVREGSLTYGDFNKHRDAMNKQGKIPFKTQQYEQSKVTILTGVLGNLDAGSMQQIMNAGVNIDAALIKGFGHDKNVAKLAVKAVNDLNQYMRTFGYSANPIKWWDENKDLYQQDVQKEISSDRFGTQYKNDAVFLSNGKVDVPSTEENIVRKYEQGDYGVPGSVEAEMELDNRARKLRGMLTIEEESKYEH